MYTRDEVVEVLTQVVKEFGPDTVYKDVDPTSTEESGCRYGSDDGEPLCIVGQVLFRLDEDLFKKVHRDYEDWRFAYEEVAYKFDYDAVRVLTRVQIAQDFGDTWGHALEKVIARDY